jgi:hypothetical protein
MELDQEEEAAREANSVIKNIADVDVGNTGVFNLSSNSPYIPPEEFAGKAARSDDDDDFTLDGFQLSSPDHTKDWMYREGIEKAIAYTSGKLVGPV